MLAKQTNASPNYYVLCIDTKDLVASSAIVNGKHIHDDIAYVTVNGTRYNLKMNDAHNGFSEKPAAPSFLADGTGLMPAGSESLPSGAWVLYYKTDIQIGPSNPPTTYRITLIDKGGVTSDEAAATIEANSSTHTVTFKVVDEEGGTLTANSGYNSSTTSTSTVQVPNGTTVTFTATPYSGWELDSWTGVTSSSSLNATLTVDGDATVTVKFKRVITIQNGNSFAWKLLKDAVKVAVDGTTITIKGEIKASVSYEGGWGQIVINENLTIKGETGAENDILDASKMSRIFKVASGKTLTLKNLTLKGGKPNETEDADKCGGAIYAKNANEIKIINCTITGNEADTNGGGIYVEGTPTTITNCIFTGNTAKNGGGIYIIQGDRIPVVTISGGTIGGTGTGEANKATGSDGNGGGIYVGDRCKVILQNNDSTGCTIKGNTAQLGGGVYAANKADVSMKGGTQIAVDNDVYLYSGSAILVYNALATAGTVARITPEKYSEFPPVKVLYGDAVGSEHAKFDVTPKGDEYWTVDSNGYLTKNKTDIFNNITKDQIKAAIEAAIAADPSTIYNEGDKIDYTELNGRLVLYETRWNSHTNYGIMHVTEVDNGNGYIKFNYKTFITYNSSVKEENDKVVNGGDRFDLDTGNVNVNGSDFYLKNTGQKRFKVLDNAKFYILPN